ncbi:flagellar protein FliJ [Geomicrobium sp. JCM 19037]|uniref:flagellar export protein FliJ n=1 Tax=unclassified Geomicrobium TaxID=2628951 RepID=UPI00045F2C55|nr:flagellar export protein FliJ [Geomicrobium sp. JCM 19037]GAK02055.1 flagellar protein FliJ [Geomicrobium sp. JCM 19037]
MTFRFRLEKLLQVKENEANDCQVKYNEAVKKFETVGYELYHWLKQKETTKQKVDQNVVAGTTIAALQEAELMSKRLEKQILIWQHEADVSRQHMVKMKQEWQAANTELKKLEKMKGKNKEREREEQNRLEQLQLDETAVMQYIRAE